MTLRDRGNKCRVLCGDYRHISKADCRQKSALGAQVAVFAVKGDNIAEGNEQFFLNLLTATNAGIQDPTGIGAITNDDGSALQVLGGATLSGTGAEVLKYDAVQPLVSAAIDYWRAAGVDATQMVTLADLQVQIVDLPDTILGLASPGLIILDLDAAGYGWSASLGATRTGRSEERRVGKEC